jgi:hypothetical protein
MDFAHETGADDRCLNSTHKWRILPFNYEILRLPRIHFITGFGCCYTVVLTVEAWLRRGGTMVVRIRFSYGDAIRRTAIANRQAALIISALMTPVAVMAWALGGWRLAADMRWTGEFAIATGIFSHWQVWIALAIALQFAAFFLHRYASREALEDDDAAVL